MNTGRYVRDVADRAFRQMIQVVIPILTVAATTGAPGDVDWAGAAWAVTVAAAVSVLTSAAGIRVDATARLRWQVAERAVKAAAASLAATLSGTTLSMMSGMGWRAVLASAAASAALSVAQTLTSTTREA